MNDKNGLRKETLFMDWKHEPPHSILNARLRAQ
jgi:hypothetical protein